MLAAVESMTFAPGFSGMTFNEDFTSPPSIAFQGLDMVEPSAADPVGVDLQGELVFYLGKADDFRLDVGGSCHFDLEGPWRIYIAVQPYHYAGRVYWMFSRALFVDPVTGERRGMDTHGCEPCLGDVAAVINRKMDSMEDPFADMITMAADQVFKLVALEPATADLVFGNRELLEALDYELDDDDEPYPANDEVVMVRIDVGEAAVVALER